MHLFFVLVIAASISQVSQSHEVTLGKKDMKDNCVVIHYPGRRGQGVLPSPGIRSVPRAAVVTA